MRRQAEKLKIYRQSAAILPESRVENQHWPQFRSHFAQQRMFSRRAILAKGQMRSNKEKKKPKQDKKAKGASATAATVFAAEAKPGAKGKK